MEEREMITMEAVMNILELQRQGYSKNAIASALKIDWKTVDKYIKNKGSIPKGIRKKRQSKLDKYTNYIQARLDSYPRLSAIRLYEEIRQKGYDGKLTILRGYVHQIKDQKRRVAVVRYETIPGEQSQIDFGYFGTIPHHGIERKLYAFVAIMGYSRMRFVRFVLSMDTITLLRCLKKAFGYFGGIPRECLFDRPKTVVLEGGWNDVVYNPRLLDFANFYGFRPRVCKPYRPQTKGKVEKSVDFVRNNFFYGKEFDDLDELNFHAGLWCDKINARVHSETNDIPLERLKKENLSPLPSQEYEVNYIESRIVSRDCRIRLWGNKYSVSHESAGRPVTVKITEQEDVKIYDKTRLAGVHSLCFEKGKSIVDRDHQKALWSYLYKSLKPTADKEQEQSIQVELRPLAYYEEVAGL